MAIYEFEGQVPQIGANSYVHPEAVLIGAVEIGENCYIGANAVLRADTGKIKIGNGTNVQDGAVIHADPKTTAFIGENNLIGHNAMLHGPLVMGEDIMIGIGAIVLMNCEIGDGCIIAAGSVIKNNSKIPSRRMMAGIPAHEVREVSEQAVTFTKIGVKIYQELAERSLKGLKRVDI